MHHAFFFAGLIGLRVLVKITSHGLILAYVYITLVEQIIDLIK